MTSPDYNIAGRMSGIFVDSQLTPLLIFGITLFGILALLFTPREENPQIQVPGAQVRVDLPGASSLEIEALVVSQLESVLSEMEDVEHTYSTSVNSVGIVQVEFDVGVDKEDALVRVNEKIDRNRNLLPVGAGPPIVTPVNADDVPIVSIALHSKIYDDYALKRLADRMAERLRSLKDVSVVEVVGGQDREIRVELDPERMMAFGITLDQGLAALAASNIAGPVGDSVRSNTLSKVYLDGQVKSALDVAQLVVGNHQGRLIYLEDVADVIDGPPADRQFVTRFGYGKGDHSAQKAGFQAGAEFSSVSIAVAKKPGTNAVVVAEAALDRIERMKQKFIPLDVEIVVTRNDGQKANAAVNDLVLALGIAIVSVMVVLVLFLGWREALIVTLTVPLTLFMVLMFNYVTGITTNRVTLFGFILSLGILVDAGIVVVENIHRHVAENPDIDRKKMIVLATNEIGNPTNLATFAIMAVFGSLMMLTDIQGQYFFPITMDVPVVMFSSLIIAYLVAPWAGLWWLTPETVGEKIRFGSERLNRARIRMLKTMRRRLPGAMGQLQPLTQLLYGGDQITESRTGRLYDAALCALLDKKTLRWGFYFFLFLLLVGSLLQPLWQFVRPQGITGPISSAAVAVTFLPKNNANFFSIFINMPEDAPLEQTDQLARDLGQLVASLPEVKNYQTNLGIPGVIDLAGLMRGNLNRYGPYLGEMRVNLVDHKERDKHSINIVRDLRNPVEKILRNYPGALVQLAEDPPGPPFPAMINAEIYGRDIAQLQRLAKQVEEQFNQTWGVAEVHDSEPIDVRRHRIVVDQEKAALAGVTTAQIATALEVLFKGLSVGEVHIPGELNRVSIVGKVPRKQELRPDELDRIYVSNAQNKRIPLSSITRLVLDNQDRPILHKDNERVVYVGGEQTNNVHIYSVIDLDRRIDGLPLEGGGQLSTGNLGLFAEDPDTIDGYRLLWGGEARFMLDSFLEMGYALMLAILLVYLILVGYYRSFSLPALALVALPLALIGVFPGHWVMDAVFSGPSIIGVIALAGIGVRTSLLIMDFVRDNVRIGMPLREATRTAGIVRLRPIFLTAITIVLGSIIMIDDPVFGGLAISLISGTITSTAFAIFVVPALYYQFLKKGNRIADIQPASTIV